MTPYHLLIAIRLVCVCVVCVIADVAYVYQDIKQLLLEEEQSSNYGDKSIALDGTLPCKTLQFTCKASCLLT